jgi:metal-responsive CopG/Arc/MetJ family transcriptional regulator
MKKAHRSDQKIARIGRPRLMDDGKVVGISISSEMIFELDEHAAKNEQSRSEVIREAVADYLYKHA